MPLADVLDQFRGLPTHALLVHFTVVIATAGAIAGVVYGLVPRTRTWLGWPLVATGVASVVLGLITPSSGEALEKRVPPSRLLEEHTELGGQLGTIMIVYGVILVLAVLAVRVPAIKKVTGTTAIATLLAVLVLAGGVVSGIWTFRTGEAGARSVWADTPTASAGR